jgi:hypothetical protein
MPEDTPQRVRIWRFRNAPSEFRALFPQGKDEDWLVHAAESELRIVEPSLLGWRHIHPVELVTFPDGSTVFWGAPREAVRSLAKMGKAVVETLPSGTERRRAARLRIECPVHYEILSDPRRTGEGHTVDLSSTGICFTAESLLPTNVKVSVHVKWPVHLEGDIPVELHAVGRLVRAESLKAAMEVEETKFWSPR